MRGTHSGRLEQAMGAMTRAGVDALLVGPGADLRYLTGYHALAMERLTLLVGRADGVHRLVVPRLELPRAAEAGASVELVAWDEADDPFDLVEAGLEGLAGDASLAVGDHLWASFLLSLQQRRPRARWTRASAVLADLRMRKEPEELEALRRAAAAIDRVHRSVPGLLGVGRTESEAGRDIAERIVAEGHDEVAFVIVASGPNGASPHHETGDRRLEEGDAVVVDIGGVMDGYCSDSTRNYVVTRAPDGYAEVHEALEQAQEAAVAAVRPGATAESVDAAARKVLAEAGYAEWFVHRTGHGIGLEVHEEPYIVGGNDLVLEAGMTFSVEPGVYLPGRFGMRIEDIVAVTPDGVERLNVNPHGAVVA